MLTSSDINAEELSIRETEERGNHDNYKAFSLNTLSHTDEEQTFLKEIYAGVGTYQPNIRTAEHKHNLENYTTLALDTLEHLDADETFKKERFHRGEDGTLNLDLAKVENQELNYSYTALESNSNETADEEQTFRKQKYCEDSQEVSLICSDKHGANSYSHDGSAKPVFPQEPSECWNLRLLLVRLSRDITDDELDIIKFLLIGSNHDVGTHCLQNATKLKVFDLLHTSNFITSKDLLYLQMILAAIGKESLTDMVYKYAQNTTNVLHFDPPLKTTGNQLTEVCVRGADFSIFTPGQLKEFCDRIKRIIAICPNDGTTASACQQERLSIFVGADSGVSTGVTPGMHSCYKRKRQCIVSCDSGVQTNLDFVEDPEKQYQHRLEEENARLKMQLSEAETRIQIQAREISEMQDRRLKTEDESCHIFSEICPFLMKDNSNTTDASENISLSGISTKKTTKEIEYELHSLKKEHSVLRFTASLLVEKEDNRQSKYNEALEKFDADLSKYREENKELKLKTSMSVEKANSWQSKYNKALEKFDADLSKCHTENKELKVKTSMLIEKANSWQSKYNEAQEKFDTDLSKCCEENKELRVEKTDTEIQMGILKRYFDELEAKLKKRIEEENSLITGLRNELELATASLLNAQNDKRLFELTRCLEQIASMSMTVKKVYGNFDPAHEHILPKQDEHSRKALSERIGRIFPQIYYTSEKR